MNIERQPNMHDLSWFIDMDKQGRLDLDPPYQRLSVWTSKDRTYFLDTIFNNYPCPAIYVQKDVTAAGPRYNVVDGKQRLTTILGFFNNKIRLPKDFAITRLAGKRFKDIESDDVVIFYNYVFLVETLRSTGDIGWHEVFFRVNKNQKTLTEQELRHARYDGWLISWAEAQVTDPEPSAFWTRMRISTKARTKRMKDVEIVSTFMLIMLERDFVGFPQSNLDALYAKYDFELADLQSDDEQEDGAESDENGLSNVEEVLEGDVAVAKPSRSEIEAVVADFEHLKTFIVAMNDHNGSVERHVRRMTTDLYSLWAMLALSDVRTTFTPVQVADAYDAFLTEVDALFEADDPTQSQASVEALSYYQHSVGAATTAPARRSRHDALLSFIKGFEA